MDRSPTCLKCKGNNLKPGALLSFGGFFHSVRFFRPNGGSSRSSKNHAVPVSATMCVDCGFVEISADPEAAKAVNKRIESGV